VVNILRKLIRSIRGFFIIWPRDVKDVMAPAVRLLEKNKYAEAGREIAKISLDVCAKIEGRIMNPRRADLYYTYLLDVVDLSKIPLQREVKALILEGNALHHYGSKFGADLNRMKDLANNILREDSDN